MKKAGRPPDGRSPVNKQQIDVKKLSFRRTDQMPFGLPWSEQFIRQISDKEIRDEFVADQIRSRIALLIRALREQEDRCWSQAELGERMGKPQSVISRIENPDYEGISLQTLFEVAAAYDLPLWVDMPEWDEWARRIGEVQKGRLRRQSFDPDKLIAQARLAESCARNGQIPQISNLDEMRITTSCQKAAVKLNGDPAQFETAVV